MESAAEIIESMTRAAAPGQETLGEEETARLRELTGDLAAARPGAAAEYARFLAIGGRGLPLPEDALRDRLAGKSVLVTGGTGCIGSALMRLLADRGVRRLNSYSRGESAGWPRLIQGGYYGGDVRDRDVLGLIIRTERPDVIFHCAAQRSPALAEQEVHRTVTTNVLGTRNVLEAARREGVPQVVTASTGKALRPWSPEVYTASKRAAEHLAAEAAEAEGGGMLVSAARFTHVLDNSIVHARLLEAASSRGGVMRLHSPHIAFYVQSALESARLMLAAFLGAERGEFRVHAIRDLGWPVSLLDVALGARGRRSAPLYFSGYDPGYEESPFPGLYDPATAGDVSPLMNAFEAAALAEPPAGTEGVDAFRLRTADDGTAREALGTLADACALTERPDVLRLFLGDLSWALLDATLAAADPGAVARAARLASAHEGGMSPDHRRVAGALRARAASGTLA